MRKSWQTILVLLFVICITLCFPGCTTEPIETDLLIPIDYANIPEDMILTDFHTDTIEIKIKAHPRLIELINTKNTRYTVDLYTDLEFDPAGDSDSIETGTYLIPVEEERIPMNPSIRILNINPSYLNIQLEKKEKKIFRVTVPYIGNPPTGYIALEAAATPSTVELTGTLDQINAIQQLKTKPIDLSNAKEDFKKEIPLDLNNPELISASNPIIVVTVPIQQQLVTKKITDIPVRLMNSSYKASLEPPGITVTIKGPFETLGNKIILDQIYSFIDLNGLGPGIYVRHAYINIPVNLIMTEAAPQVFTLKIE
ncbi:MAG: YbbR-like domain-containing protein [Proteobacteria bacterium]|nr:YbbR-like domain-containing protein [Pseudomonadota bacterium]MBU1389995.1 YbbR-like domain-containing protein [Pseudomonadota bacterium]MBU1545054.1 YbbR-like domain-containing protein [Pseudomonadota bacterium]MBU2431303.1 YbbR-like domain-containing protein [Pseudomonadota bacterium]MBU2480433.1 YbbR-like domain-containing protein [Pseudomonadota bacterium]